MKKIISLVFASIICSQVVYPVDAARKVELKAQIKALGGSLAGLGNAGIARLEAVLEALKPAPVLHQTVRVAVAPRQMLMAPPLPEARDIPLVADRLADEPAPTGGICGWASWLLGGCFGGCATIAETVERNPLTACCGLSLCCCCCGYATTTVMATESLAPGVLAACNMCKTGEYACSLITFGCAAGQCGTKTVVKGCAHCVSDLARRGQRACLPAEHMD